MAKKRAKIKPKKSRKPLKKKKAAAKAKVKAKKASKKTKKAKKPAKKAVAKTKKVKKAPKAKTKPKKAAKPAAKPVLKKTPVAKAVSAPSPVAAAPEADMPLPGHAIGKVVHYYDRIGVAIVNLARELRVGDKITFKRGDRSFMQKITSMQISHHPVEEAGAGQVVGMKVDQVAPEGTILLP